MGYEGYNQIHGEVETTQFVKESPVELEAIHDLAHQTTQSMNKKSMGI